MLTFLRSLFVCVSLLYGVGFFQLSLASEPPIKLSPFAQNAIVYQQDFGSEVPESITVKSINKDIYVGNGFRGKSLKLVDRDFAELQIGSKVNGKEGTILFWIKPLWEKTDKISHVLLSMRWEDGKQGYLAVSHGWWEPGGSKRLYFILNNQEYAHVSAYHELDVDSWSRIAVTWKSGQQGYCRLFVDDQKIAERTMGFVGDYSSGGNFYFGSDKGSTVETGRQSNFLLDEMVILNRSLSDREVTESFVAEGGDLAAALEKRLKWFGAWTATLPVQPKRDSKGNLLETRAVFDESIEWALSKGSADNILTRIKAAGFNVYIPNIWNGYGTRYPTKLTKCEARLEHVLADNNDPLAYLVSKAHSMGIEVHPWVTVSGRWWSDYPEFYDDGTPDHAYDMHKPEFRRFIVNLMLDVVRRYDIDGMNLDYIRTKGLCTSQFCRDDYYEKTGSFLMLDSTLMHKVEASRKRIEKWQDEAVADVVSDFATQARKIKPNLIVSVDGNPIPSSKNRPLEGRDEISWVNKGWVDVVYNMDYDLYIDVDALNLARKEFKSPEQLYELFGNYEYRDSVLTSRPGLIIEKYIELSRNKWPGSGIGLFLYRALSDEQIKVLSSGPFIENALPQWPQKTSEMQ